MNEPLPVALYDADCGFCTASAHTMTGPVIRARVVAEPFQAYELAGAGLTPDACAESLHVLADDRVYVGASAIARILRAGRLPWRVLGHLLTLPGVRWLAERVYRLVARNRHRLPGATAACEMP